MSSEQLREEARSILAEKRFHETDLPRPFRAPLQWLGDRLKPVWRALSDAFDWFAGILPGGTITAWIVIGLGLIALVVLAARMAIDRREAEAVQEAEADVRDLAAEAAEAERAGDWERAVRLRFRAGVVRLEQRGALSHGESRTTGEVVRAAPGLGALGERFDAIAYGGAAADETDAAAARETWERV